MVIRDKSSQSKLISQLSRDDILLWGNSVWLNAIDASSNHLIGAILVYRRWWCLTSLCTMSRDKDRSFLTFNTQNVLIGQKMATVMVFSFHVLSFIKIILLFLYRPICTIYIKNRKKILSWLVTINMTVGLECIPLTGMNYYFLRSVKQGALSWRWVRH